MSKEHGTKRPNVGQIRETPMTYEEYAELPDDGNRYELVDGQLELMSPSPARTHQIISRRLLLLLSQDCESDYEIVAAPVDVVLSDVEVRQPDLVMIHLSRLSIYKERGSIVEPPDLVIEILSPNSLKRDKIAKHQAYARFGVPEYWILNPADETLEQHLLGPDRTYELVDVYTGDESIHSERLKCISFSMNEVMSRVRNLPDA
jgi:Uma2 family endonuclease